ncbi:hypothetical protein JAAARDRAFT_197933 [Jaapia argillacea MUCL 33604]|uniref:Uncharacterized protein n=1 Tax=Jaapia argillacea MUCL 33604 TaxID=933084 RepID=A0A067PRC8_9AGAM|nr:hypothetical protein JAAARDRAFT_197933 [Jaapia argillacea MUCL 33604]
MAAEDSNLRDIEHLLAIGDLKLEDVVMDGSKEGPRQTLSPSISRCPTSTPASLPHSTSILNPLDPPSNPIATQPTTPCRKGKKRWPNTAPNPHNTVTVFSSTPRHPIAAPTNEMNPPPPHAAPTSAPATASTIPSPYTPAFHQPGGHQGSNGKTYVIGSGHETGVTNQWYESRYHHSSVA